MAVTWTAITAKTLDAFFCLEDWNELVNNINSIYNSVPTQITLTDNVAATATGIAFAKATYRAVHIEYTIERSTTFEAGTLILTHNGTTTYMSQVNIDSDGTGESCGVTFTSDISGANVRLLYATTSTGNAGKLNYRLRLIPVAT